MLVEYYVDVRMQGFSFQYNIIKDKIDVVIFVMDLGIVWFIVSSIDVLI